MPLDGVDRAGIFSDGRCLFSYEIEDAPKHRLDLDGSLLGDLNTVLNIDQDFFDGVRYDMGAHFSFLLFAFAFHAIIILRPPLCVHTFMAYF